MRCFWCFVSVVFALAILTISGNIRNSEIEKSRNPANSFQPQFGLSNDCAFEQTTTGTDCEILVEFWKALANVSASRWYGSHENSKYVIAARDRWKLSLSLNTDERIRQMEILKIDLLGATNKKVLFFQSTAGSIVLKASDKSCFDSLLIIYPDEIDCELVQNSQKDLNCQFIARAVPSELTEQMQALERDYLIQHQINLFDVINTVFSVFRNGNGYSLELTEVRHRNQPGKN